MKHKRIIAVVVSVSLVLAFGLSSFAQERSWPEVVDQYVATAKKGVTVIDKEAFKKVIEKKGDAMILDVREPDEFKSGHLPGAVNVPRGLVEFRIWKTVGFPKTDFGKKIYIYCASGGRAVLTTKTLKDLGFTNVTAVDMKIAEWIKAGYPIER